MPTITGKTKLLGVMGDPVEHSLSPVMHNAAIQSLGVDYVYVPFPIKAEELATAIAGLAAIGIIGFNVTIPHKQAIIPLLADITSTARLVGAVNTVWHTAAGWQGTNTDIAGFVAPLKDFKRNWQNITPIILGCGGAARAVVVGLAQMGCHEIHVLGRDLDKLEQFQQSWANSSLTDSINVHSWTELPHLVSMAELIVNTTPVGMPHQSDRTPVSAELLAKLPANAIAYDLIYTPNPTQFLKDARQQGATIIDGLEMLVQQGAAALQLWLEQPVPIDTMRQSLYFYLGNR